MRREEIHIGLIVRVTRDRWDVPAGTYAMVDTVGHAGRFGEWCFTVRWRFAPQSKRAKRRDYSLNLLEADLADFEVFHDPLPRIAPPQRRRDHAIIYSVILESPCRHFVLLLARMDHHPNLISTAESGFMSDRHLSSPYPITLMSSSQPASTSMGFPLTIDPLRHLDFHL
jgi:hypothetical protein